MLSTTRIFPKTPRLKNHRPKFSGIFIHTDPSSPPIRGFHREMRASDSRCVETNALEGRGENKLWKPCASSRTSLPSCPAPLAPRGRGVGGEGALHARLPSRMRHLGAWHTALDHGSGATATCGIVGLISRARSGSAVTVTKAAHNG